MDGLVDFLNHGILPFTGRESELGRIEAFWRTTVDADGLRVMLVLGEAGSGKSRLVEELTMRLVADGGAIVRMKFYPESAVALGPHLNRAIDACELRSDWESSKRRSVADTSLGAGVSRLRRRARLRPTLLIIEDAHLLSGALVADLRTLLESLADEPMSVLLLARPVKHPAATVAERYVVDEISLQGLSVEAVSMLCTYILGSAPSAELLDAVLSATAGSPLALRSALRAIARAGLGDEDIDSAEACAALVRQVRALSTGMVAHLDHSELENARRISQLGEVVSREAARRLTDADDAIDILLFRGILTTEQQPIAPLHGSGSEHVPLRFTHTLLHRHLLESAHVDSDALVALFADGLPLYSIVPIQLARERAASSTLPVETIRRAIDRVLDIARSLDATSDWELAEQVWRAAGVLARAAVERMSDDEARVVEVAVLRTRLALLKRADYTDEYSQTIDRLVALTDDASTTELREARISALGARWAMRVSMQSHEWNDGWSEVERLINSDPLLARTNAYLSFLRECLMFAAIVGQPALAREVEHRFETLRASDDADLSVRALTRVGPPLVMFAETPDDYAARWELIGELESVLEPDDPTILVNRCNLLESQGRYAEAMPLLERHLERCRREGLNRSMSSYTVVRIHALAQLGFDIEQAYVEMRDACERAHPSVKELVARSAGLRLAHVALLRNDPASARLAVDTFLGSDAQLLREMRLVLASHEGQLAAVAGEVLGGVPENDPLARLVAAVRGEGGYELATTIDEAFARPLAIPEDVLYMIACVELTRECGSYDGYRSVVANALSRAVEYLADRGLGEQIQMVVSRCEHVLTRSEVRSLRQRAKEIVARSQVMISALPAGHGVIQLSMLGTMVLRDDNGEQPVRGSRLRAMLGLLVADAMLPDRLDHREFCLIASDREIDQERARKTMNAGVVRLRDLLGRDAILTDDTTPRLNESVVSVDLLEAHRKLAEAEESIRGGVLLRALPAMLAALEIAAGEVPFPTLYDDFFEAAREEFETRLRNTSLRVARALIEESDFAGAASLLRRWQRVIPDDEECAELLIDALQCQGNHAEAERVRIAAAYGAVGAEH